MNNQGLPAAIFDAAVDGAYTGMATLLGYFVANGQPVLPSKAALFFSAATAVGGFLNQLRALRKQPR